jgi:glycosyltransferase involved in cell wall biosynthesis
VLAGKFQGSRTYLVNLYRAVLALGSRHEFVFFGHWEGERPFGGAPHEDYPSHSRWKRLTFETDGLVRRWGLNAFHSTYISPLRLSCRSLLTVHDILFEPYPQFFSRPFVWRSKALVRLSARRAAQIHTISEYSRAQIAARYGISPGRIHLVPAGIDTSRFVPAGKAASVETIARRFGIADYVLTVGRLEPRKNHLRLLEAYAEVKRRGIPVGPLVVVGQRDFGYEEIFSRISALRLGDDIRILESVSDDELVDVYRAARVFAYPSLAEGFGIPVLEAMGCGVPAITSDRTALPEIAGDAAVLVDPERTEDLANALALLLTDGEAARKFAERGPTRAVEYAWTEAAKRYVEAIDALD